MRGLLFVAVAVATAILSQTVPAFDVASIKPHPADLNDTMMILPAPGGRLAITNASLRSMLLYAYRLQDSQLIGGPDWINSAAFDVTAKASDDRTNGQMQPMLQGLLVERFKIQSHHEMRQMTVYAMV